MKVYDFDKTIYPADSSVEFYFYCLRRHPGVLRAAPGFLWAALRYGLGRVDKTGMKTAFFAFLKAVPDAGALAAAFWEERRHRVAGWFLEGVRPGDVIISASPAFLLAPVCAGWPVVLIASQVDPATGRFEGPNNHGAQKVARLGQAFGGALPPIEDFYSDSLSDAPLAALAKRAWLVKGEAVGPWPAG